MAPPLRVAVLIDADNISPALAEAVIAEAARHGTLSVKRAYGDWTRSSLSGWKKALPRHAIQPLQQFAYVAGKNATDSALIIDAMDLLFAANIEAFCIVSSDSDYTRLAVRLRESGRRVFGMGSQQTPAAFQNACDRFTFLEFIATTPEGAPVPGDGTPGAGVASTSTSTLRRATPASKGLEAAGAILLPAVRATVGDDGWALLANVGHYIVNNHPSFDSRVYGFDKLSALVRAVPGLDTQVVADASGMGQVWVRLSTTATAGDPR